MKVSKRINVVKPKVGLPSLVKEDWVSNFCEKEDLLKEQKVKRHLDLHGDGFGVGKLSLA